MIDIVLQMLNNALVGETVPVKDEGKAGRYIEKRFKDLGIDMQNGLGPDVLDHYLEVKTRDIDSKSPLTIGSMKLDDILATDYYDTSLHDKFQHHIRVHTRNMKIIEVVYYDFRDPNIQKEIQQAYEYAKYQFLKKGDITCTKAYTFGYFENTKKGYPDWYDFRLTDKNMKRLVGLSKNTYASMFEEIA